MTSIEDVKAILERVRELAADMYRGATAARNALDEAVEILTETSRNHQESLVPPEFVLAGQKLTDLQALIAGNMEAVTGLAERL